MGFIPNIPTHLDFHSSHSTLQMGYTGRKIPDVIHKSLSHLLKDLWGDSSRTCRWHPACLWCFTIREIDPADVGVLRAGTAFLLPPPVSSLFSSPLPFLPRNEWATWGWWPVTDREETRLSTLSDSQSEWLTVEQVTPLGIDSHSWASFPVICFRYLSYCHNSNKMHYRQGIK